METLFFDKTGELRKNKVQLEEKLKVSIAIQGKKVMFEGSPINEYTASAVLDAVSFGFSVKESLTLCTDTIAFKRIPIREFTRRKNLKDVRSRLIGREGKTRRTIEEISGCSVIIAESAVGIIGDAKAIDDATQAIIRIIKGAKQANAYRLLERMNASRIKEDVFDAIVSDKKERKYLKNSGLKP